MSDDYEATEAALFATLQAAEYRVPYAPPSKWPTYECDHEWLDIGTMCEPTRRLCAICGRDEG